MLLTLLLILMALGSAAVLMVIIAALFGARALKRRNRVSSAEPSAAPTSWLGAPTAAPRLHRRLRTAVSAARAAGGAPGANPQLAEVARDLEAEAVALDAHVVAAGRLPTKARRAHLAPLAPRVQQIERLASQVSLESAQSQAPRVAAGQGGALDHLAEQLETMEAARRVVSQIESDVGIERVSPYAVPDPPPGERPQPGT